MKKVSLTALYENLVAFRDNSEEPLKDGIDAVMEYLQNYELYHPDEVEHG